MARAAGNRKRGVLMSEAKDQAADLRTRCRLLQEMLDLGGQIMQYKEGGPAVTPLLTLCRRRNEAFNRLVESCTRNSPAPADAGDCDSALREAAGRVRELAAAVKEQNALLSHKIRGLMEEAGENLNLVSRGLRLCRTYQPAKDQAGRGRILDRRE